MADITVSKLGKSYGINEIFSNVNFIINENDKVGIVGPNGAGKSTLFNILTNQIEEYEGNVYKKGDLKYGYMRQNINLDSENTIYEEMLSQFDYIYKLEKEVENLQREMEIEKDIQKLENLSHRYTEKLDKYLAYGGEYFEVKIESTLIGMGFSKERFNDKINFLSGGEKSRLELAKLLVSDFDVLLLDEPTNHLDMKTISFVENMIRNSNKTVVFISHDRYFLDKVAKRIFLLEKGSLYTYDTNYTDFIDRRKKDIEIQQRAYENQQKEIERQEEIIERFANLGGSLRKRGIAQSRSRQKLLDKMKTMDRPETFDDTMGLRFSPSRESGQDVLEVKNISKSFDNKTLYENISFNIYKGEKVGLIGANGSGKTTILKMILNKMNPDNGEINLGISVFPEYFDQEQKNLDLEKTVIDEVWDKFPNLTHYELRSYLARFMFIGDDIFNIIGDLSGGERSRVTLLELMLTDSNFLLMDEPTNHLDIQSKEVLEDALINYQATALLISHDRYFLNKVCTKIIEIENGSLIEYKGNYDYYLSKKENPLSEKESVEINKTQKRKDYKKEKGEQKRIQNIEKKIKYIDKRLEEIEIEINNLNHKFTKPEIFEDYEKSNEINLKIEKLNEEKESISIEWFELHEKLEVLEL